MWRSEVIVQALVLSFQPCVLVTEPRSPGLAQGISTHQALVLAYSPHVLRRGLTESGVHLGWPSLRLTNLTHKPQGASCLCILGAGTTHAHHCAKVKQNSTWPFGQSSPLTSFQVVRLVRQFYTVPYSLPHPHPHPLAFYLNVVAGVPDPSPHAYLALCWPETPPGLLGSFSS